MAERVLQGRVAVITGAASGIGRAVTERLAADGCRVVLGDIQAAAGEPVAAALGGVFVRCDVGRRDDCRRLIDEAVARFGGVHILVNNAGFQHVSPLERFPEDTWDRMMAVMVTGPFLLMRYAWPHMKAQGWGRVVNLGSIHSHVASPNKVGYTAAKHGLLGLTRAAALEGGEHGITVNCLCPAYVRTPLVENQIEAQATTRNISPADVVEKVMLEPAAIRRLIEPPEVAGLISFLCSDAAAAVTGSAWTMDLGWTAR